MKTKTKKRKNPADSTMRNINALKKRVTELEVSMGFALSKIDNIDCCIRNLHKKKRDV